MNYFEQFKQLADEIQANENNTSPEEAKAILDYLWHLKQPYDPMRD